MARRTEVQYVQFYTAGSAAYKFEPAAAPKKKAQLPKQRRAKKIRVFVDPMALIGACVAIVMLVMMFTGLSQWNEAKRQEAQLQAYVAQLQEENAQLRSEYLAGYDPQEIYEIATAMGMIPAEQANRIQVSVSAPVVEEEPSAWENFRMFLTGLFA